MSPSMYSCVCGVDSFFLVRGLLLPRVHIVRLFMTALAAAYNYVMQKADKGLATGVVQVSLKQMALLEL